MPVAQVTTADTLLMPPGRRYDVLVTASGHPSHNTWLRTLAYSNGPQGDSYPAVRLLKLRVAGIARRALSMPTGAMPTAPASLASARIARYRSVRLSENSAGTSLYINGKQFTPTSSIFRTAGIVNTVEQWTVLNSSAEVHPFHIHTSHFQVMSIDGVPQPYVGQVDTVPVP